MNRRERRRSARDARAERKARQPAEGPLGDMLREALGRHRSGDLDGAAALYRRVLARQPKHAGALHLFGLLHHHRGDHGDAIRYLAGALEQDPDNALYHHHIGQALAATDRPDEAEDHLQSAIHARPDFAEAYNDLGIVLDGRGRHDDAIAAYESALTARPDFAEAHNNLGIALAGQGRHEDAARHYRRALAANPRYADAHSNLGNLLSELGRHDEAVVCLRRAIEIDPDHAEAHGNLGTALGELGRTADAADSFRRAIALKPDYADAHFNLGNLLSRTGDLAGAAECYRRTLAVKSEHRSAKHLLAAVTGTTTATAPREYVRELFDDYAGRFETHLVEALEYRLPSELRDRLQGLADLSWPVGACVDLGCGTGLVGEALRPVVGRLCGVDISSRMVAQARSKAVYDRVEVGDIVAFLEQGDERYDLFVAADVLIYVGDLEPLFTAIVRTANPRAAFACSVEDCGGDGFVLNRYGRYMHSAAYVGAMARDHGFTVERRDPIVVRTSHGQPVPGTFYVLRA